MIIRTQAQAPNTGELEPREDAVGNFADLTVNGTLTAPPVAGMGGFIDMPATTIRNDGTRSADPDGSFRWDYYRSLDAEISGRDFAFGVGGSADSLGPDGSIGFGPRRLVMPFSTGQLYLGVFADADNAVSEGSETNNTLVTSDPVTIVPYQASITTQTVPDPDNPALNRTVARVSVSQLTGPESFSVVPGATVTLALERPIAESNQPGDVEPGFPVMTATTDATGVAQFLLPEPLPGSGIYRFVATVTT